MADSSMHIFLLVAYQGIRRWAYSVFKVDTAGPGVAINAVGDKAVGGSTIAGVAAGVAACWVSVGVGAEVDRGCGEVAGTGGGDVVGYGCGGGDDGCHLCGDGYGAGGVLVGVGRREGGFTW